jgi:P-type conjugative transfer protein TrbJ
MKLPAFRKMALASVAAVAIAAASPATAMIVFDPSNYAQNLLTAARSLQQINNQVQQLQNQALMLANQARNLKSLPLSMLQQVQQDMTQISSLLGQAGRIAYTVQSVDRQFSTNYPTSFSLSTSKQSLVASAQARWLNSVSAFQNAMDVQSGVVSTMPSTQGQVNSLVSASQGATGVLQAIQAQNQLLAIQSKQLSDLTALIAAQGRASTLNQAGQAETKAEADVLFQQFLSTGAGYQPQPVQMFH